MFLLLALVALAGCVEERVVKPSFASLREVADQNKPRQDRKTGDTAEPGDGGWAILVAELKGDDRYLRAQQFNARLHGYDVPTIWTEDYGTQLNLYSGHFSNPNDPESKLALSSITSIEFDGEHPFQRAHLVPLRNEVNFQLDPMDLRQYTGAYTLEIATFTRDFEDRKHAAEDMARKLREQKLDAYFYHGPNNSSVCLRLFYDADFIIQGNILVPGPEMVSFQKEHADYLIDGVNAKDLPPPPEGALPRPNRSYFVRVL